MLGTNDTKERFNASAGVIGLGLQRLIEVSKQTQVWTNKPNILIVTPKAIDKRYETTPVY